jgi:hypothetical protein
MLNFLTDSSVIRSNLLNDLPLSSEIILENAWDAYHVDLVHKGSVKSCQVIKDFGDVVVMLYEYYPISWLRFVTKKFLVVKSRSSLKPKEVHFLSFSVNFSFVSWATVRATASAKGALLEHRLRMRVPKLMYVLLGRFLDRKRNKGEAIRLKEDMEIMLERQKALEQGFQENRQCLLKTELLSVWFPEQTGIK